MGREFLLHLYLESPVFFQIQPGNLEQPVGTDKCSIARACTLGPSSHVFMLFIQLFIDVFKRWKQSLSPPTFHPRKPSRELAAYSGQGQEKPSTSYVPFWIRPLRLPFSWSFGGSFEWEPQNRFALLTQESWEAQIDSQCQIFSKWSLRPWSIYFKIYMWTSDFASPQRTLCPLGHVCSGAWSSCNSFVECT